MAYRCPCKSCKLSRRARMVIANGSHRQKAALIYELLNMWTDTSADLNYHEAIMDGSWPQSVEILERALVKAKELQVQEEKRKV